MIASIFLGFGFSRVGIRSILMWPPVSSVYEADRKVAVNNMYEDISRVHAVGILNAYRTTTSYTVRNMIIRNPIPEMDAQNLLNLLSAGCILTIFITAIQSHTIFVGGTCPAGTKPLITRAVFPVYICELFGLRAGCGVFVPDCLRRRFPELHFISGRDIHILSHIR